MNSHESQREQALAQFGMVVPAGGAATTQEETQAIGGRLFTTGLKPVLIKSRNHARVIINGIASTAAVKITALTDGAPVFPKRPW